MSSFCKSRKHTERRNFESVNHWAWNSSHIQKLQICNISLTLKVVTHKAPAKASVEPEQCAICATATHVAILRIYPGNPRPTGPQQGCQSFGDVENARISWAKDIWIHPWKWCQLHEEFEKKERRLCSPGGTELAGPWRRWGGEVEAEILKPGRCGKGFLILISFSLFVL